MRKQLWWCLAAQLGETTTKGEPLFPDGNHSCPQWAHSFSNIVIRINYLHLE